MTPEQLEKELKKLWKAICCNTGGTTEFTLLTDGPGAFTGHAGESVRVNVTEDALEYFAAVGSGTVTSVDMSVPSFLSISGNPITTTGTLAVSFSGTALPAANGGTGQTSYAIGDLLYASGASTLSKLPSVASGSFLFSNGVGVAPSWESINLVVTPAGTGEAVLFDLGTNILYHKAIGNSTFISASTAADTISLALSATGTPDGTTFLRGDNTWATPSGGGTNTFSISASGVNNTTLTDGATQYIGPYAVGQTSSATNHPVYIDRTCTLKSIVVNSFASTAGTNEDWSLYVRVNDTTDYLIETLGSSSNNRVWNNNALNISLVAGDVIIIKNVQPTWATNPASVVFSWYANFEY